MKKYSKGIICLSISLLIILVCSVNVFCATVGSYEYNDFILYNTSGGVVDGGAFRSDFATSGEIGIRIYPNGNWTIYSGQNESTATVIPCPSNMRVDTTQLSTNGGYITVNGNTIYFRPHEILEYWYAYGIPTDPYYPQVYVYLPYATSSSGQTVPPTPTLTLNGNQLYWTSPDYTAIIIYTDDNVWDGTHTVISSSAQSPYTLSTNGFYKVALNYVDPTTQQVVHTDYSNTIMYERYADDTDNIFEKIWHTIMGGLAAIENSVSNLFGYINTMTDLLEGLLDFLPTDVVNAYWAVVIVGLVLTLL